MGNCDDLIDAAMMSPTLAHAAALSPGRKLGAAAPAAEKAAACSSAASDSWYSEKAYAADRTESAPRQKT